MAFGTTLYNLVLKRTSTFMVVVVGATFFFERGVDVAAEKFWDSHNKGKLWKHIKDKYE
ncbi:hypothetical protein DMN91_001465 [Ooceraea biroi]|uniref:Complex III subunit 9 n=1 Tax=Ooceraea biroi TaxID=2015173 RepID=A0A026WPE6_OOCBI|nr:cytochrome b-c1 complex subunit 9 [Ooceraea biroi]EZA57927.1 Cytochrome b-c1 complex subunit [Ooceraea biroi]RLU25309.1 hypothetical protein DMN91_001465 [Ooceraea biroi]